MRYLPFLALLLPLTAHAAVTGMTTQIGVQVRTDQNVAVYSDNQDQDVPIALPTQRFACVRRPVLTTATDIVVLVTCTEGTREAFVVGTSCSRSEPAEHVSVVAVNVSKTTQPLIVAFTVGCTTQPKVLTL